MRNLVVLFILTLSGTILSMIESLRDLLGWMISAFRSREDLVLENLALRQQLRALHAQRPRRRLTALHKLFWVALQTFWSGWRKPLILVTPRAVVNWHGKGFRLYWRLLSRVRRVGERKRVSKEVRALIFRMVAENPTWGAPRIHGELLKLGFGCGCEGDGKPANSHCLSQSMAERSCGTLGWKLPARLAGPRDHAERAASETAGVSVSALLSRRPDSSRAREGHTRRASCGVGIAKGKQDRLVAETRRAPSPLQGSGLSHLWPRTATV